MRFSHPVSRVGVRPVCGEGRRLCRGDEQARRVERMLFMRNAIQLLRVFVCAVIGITGCFPPAGLAEVGSATPGSILVFPHVEVDADSDTVIQVGNSSNLIIDARCFYIDATVSGSCDRSDFVIRLLRGQSSHWVASRGRAVADDPRCTPSNSDCDGAGIDPGVVPGLPTPFRGALACVQVDVSGAPLGANGLIGSALLKNGASGQVSRYNAIGIAGFDVYPDDQLLLDGVEYSACPEAWMVDHVADGAEDIVAGTGSSVETSLTVLPCSLDLVNLNQPTVGVLLQTYDEFESALSTSTTLACWLNATFGDVSFIFDFAPLGTRYRHTRIATPLPSGPGLLLVGSEAHVSAAPENFVASAAFNAHADGIRPESDVITLPPFVP